MDRRVVRITFFLEDLSRARRMSAEVSRPMIPATEEVAVWAQAGSWSKSMDGYVESSSKSMTANWKAEIHIFE